METAKKVVFGVVVLVLLYVGLSPFFGGIRAMAAFGVMQAVAVGFGLGLIIALYVAPYFWERMATGVFFPRESVIPPPPELPGIRLKVVSEHYDEALADLKALMAKDPGNIHVASLVAEVFLDKQKDFEKAVGFIEGYLRRKKGRGHDDVALLMRHADACYELDSPGRAADFLEQESKKGYSSVDIKAIRKRLETARKAAGRG